MATSAACLLNTPLVSSKLDKEVQLYEPLNKVLPTILLVGTSSSRKVLPPKEGEKQKELTRSAILPGFVPDFYQLGAFFPGPSETLRSQKYPFLGQATFMMAGSYFPWAGQDSCWLGATFLLLRKSVKVEKMDLGSLKCQLLAC